MTTNASKGLGLSVTIAVHAALALLLMLSLRTALPPVLPEPVPVKLLPDAPSPKPETKPLPPVANAVIHPQMTVPVLIVPVLKVAEQPKTELPKLERPTAITLPPPAAPAAHSDDKEMDFQARLMAHLNSLKRYPAEAKRQGKMGVVMVRFRIDRAGHMLTYRIEQGSGQIVLDEETARLMQRADPFPAPPDSVTGAELEFVVPVQYRLG